MDFSAFNQRRTSPLSFASRVGDLSVLKKLLKKRTCDVNYNDSRGWTALHEAAAHDRVEATKLILHHKSCRPCVRSHDGKTALFVALVAKCSMKIIDLLLTIEGIVNCGTNEDVTPLHVVAQQGRIEAAVALIRSGADINKPDFDGDTPLHEAAHAGHSDLVSLLLHCGCNPEPKNDQRYTPLHLACMLPNSESVQRILMFSTDVNCHSNNGDTPLSLAAQKSSLQTVKLLLENEASPHLSASDDCIPLYHAMLNDNVSVFKLLLENTNYNEINFNIIRMASDPTLFNTGIFEILLKSDLGPEFFNIDHDSELESFHRKISKKVAPPLAPFLKVADYLYTTKPDNFECLIMLFLMRGVPVNATHANEWSPLSYFQLCPHTHCGNEVLRILVEHGVNVDYSRGDEHEFPEAILICHLYGRLFIPTIFQYTLAVDPIHIAKEELKVHGDLPDGLNSEDVFLNNLKHFCRLSIREQLRKGGHIKTTQELLSKLYKLPLPIALCDYLRFLK